MKKIIIVTLAIVCGIAQAQTSFFNDKDLTIVGAYYYPEHWSESEWELAPLSL